MSVSPVLAARARTGVAARSGDPHRIEDAHRDLAAEKIAAYIEKVVSAAPPLTGAQKSRLTALIGGGA
jgi:hypothetical protein